MSPTAGGRLAVAMGLTIFSVAGATSAQEPSYNGKLTLGTYRVADNSALDVNARYALGAWTGWLGYYASTDDTRQGRAGIEYDFRHRWLYLVPSAQAAGQGFFGATVYAEIGNPIYLIAGVSRTNLKPYVNLTFDPNESWQFGAGSHVGKAGTAALYTIWDNRLGTGQEITHASIRWRFEHVQRVTIDVSYKSGHGDGGAYLRGGAAAVEYDWRRWFAKAARDEHANFSLDTMWRLGGGLRF